MSPAGSAAESGSAGQPPTDAAAQGGTPRSAPTHAGAAGSGASASRPEPPAGGCADFANSFDALQKLVLERRGCTASACHGDAEVGGLDLRASAAWQNLVEVSASGSKLVRVKPGDPAQSYLYLKLQAATEPGTVQVAGSPMPVGTAPLSARELQAVALWIRKGAPQTGVVTNDEGGDLTSLLDLCGSVPGVDKPLEDKPLLPPPPDKGIQIVMPQYVLKAQSETETCTPFAYDLTDQVPAQYKDAANNIVYINGSLVRQSPQSHHLILWDPKTALTSIAADDPLWTCRGGPNDGKQCNAHKGSADCGTGGACAGPTNAGSLCGIETLAFGSGTPEDILKGLLGQGDKPLTPEDLAGLLALLGNPSGTPEQIANAQTIEQDVPPLDGIYMKMPLRGVMWYNSHAFNLTDRDATLQARVNWLYATERKRELLRTSNTSFNNAAHGQPPFTRKSYCGQTEVPRNYSLVTLTGHFHRRGEQFTIRDASGKQLYENFDYADPAYTHFDPWIVFDAPDAAARTLEFCATYNNGVKDDGSPDVEFVTRASRMPERGKCTPVACVAGKVAAACQTDRDCDSAPGANDGSCDACTIVAGQTTENEMFVMTGWYVLPPSAESGAQP